MKIPEDQANTQYTKLLNEQYPQRKYLRHNLTSWLRCSKGKIKDISVKIINNDLKSKLDNFSLRKFKYNEEFNDAELNQLEKALEVIKVLRNKILQYEETNNENIEIAMNIIESLKNENEFFCNKLIENYQKIEKYEDEYGDIALSDFKFKKLKNFQDFRLKSKIFKFLMKNRENSKIFKEKMNNLQEKADYFKKVKAFVSLSKNVMVNKYSLKLKQKRLFVLIKNAFDSMKSNVVLNRKIEKFLKIQRTIKLIFWFKNLTINSKMQRINEIFEVKALKLYYQTIIRKVLFSLKENHRISNIINKNPSKSENIRFINFLRETGLTNAPSEIREMRLKGIKKLRKIYQSKINNNSKESTFAETLKKYLSLWKKSAANSCCYSPIIMGVHFQNFRKNVNEFIKEKNLKNRFKIYKYKEFINKLRLKNKLKNNFKLANKSRSTLIFKKFFNLVGNELKNGSFSKFRKISRVIKLSMFFEKMNLFLKEKSKMRKQQNSIIKLKQNSFNVKMKQQMLKMIKFVKSKIRMNKRIVSTKFKIQQNLILRYLCFIRVKVSRHQVICLQLAYSQAIDKIKANDEERSKYILQLEQESKEYEFRLKEAKEKSKTDKDENQKLRQEIVILEKKIKENNEKFNELWLKNVEDIKNLRETLAKNEKIISSAISREQQMQDKYCEDINNAVSLNKQLNSIINKKNIQLNDLKAKINSHDKANIEDKKRLMNENLELYENVANIYEKKNKHIRMIDHEKQRILEETSSKIKDIEEQKLKHEFKANILEDENRQIFNEYLTILKKK